MKILIFNSRINSIDFAVWEMPEEVLLLEGNVNSIGTENSVITIRKKDTPLSKAIRKSLTHEEAFVNIVEVLKKNNLYEKIEVAGHRVVHGMDFDKPTIIDEAVKQKIYKDINIAFIHNPYNLKIIDASIKEFLTIKQIAIFDTAFHSTMPEVAYRYPIPERFYNDYKIKRYGFHGLSHKYLLEKTAQYLDKTVSEVNMISCYLGDGSSITMIKRGKSTDTSMGFTPLSGLMMTTRSGDISPSVVIYLLKMGWSIEDVERILFKESGVVGVCGEGDDLKEVVKFAVQGNKRCKLAVDMFVYSIRKFIGAYWLQMPELDAISLTGKIAEGIPYIRKRIFENLEKFGILIANFKNDECIPKDSTITSDDSKIKVFVFSRSSGILLARETYQTFVSI